jgi:hypothetical protein
MYLFNLKKDPEEKENLIHSEIEKAESFHAVVKNFFRDNRKISGFLERKIPQHPGHKIDQKSDEEVTKQLKALGYFD